MESSETTARVLDRRQPHRGDAGLDRGGARARRARPGSVHAAGARPPPTACTSSSTRRTTGHSEAEATIELALPLLEEAAGKPVEPMVGVAEPLAAIQDALNLHGFDELIISTLPTRVSRWLKLDLPHKAAGLGVPVTTVTAQGTERIEAHA